MSRNPVSPRESIETVKSRHELELLRIEGVEGVGISEERGKPVITVYVTKATEVLQQKIPDQLEGYAVKIEVSGEFRAF